MFVSYVCNSILKISNVVTFRVSCLDRACIVNTYPKKDPSQKNDSRTIVHKVMWIASNSSNCHEHISTDLSGSSRQTDAFNRVMSTVGMYICRVRIIYLSFSSSSSSYLSIDR